MDITPHTLLADDLSKRSFLGGIIKRVFEENELEFDYGKYWESLAKITREEYRRLLAIFYRKPNSEFISAIKSKLKMRY